MSITSDREAVRVLVVGTAPPTRCGLASYTHNVSNALANQHIDVDILRVLDDGDSTTGEPSSVSAYWLRKQKSDAQSASAIANGYDAVLLQHEFGIYPGDDGVDVLSFLDSLEIPLVTVLHTILSEPSNRQQHIIDEIVNRSDDLVVHSGTARDRLVEHHKVDYQDVRIIPHGASSRIGLTQPLDRMVPSMLTWGLIGPGKGIEHGISATALLRQQGIDVEYVISGATHPNVLRDSGDSYRHSLVSLARKLKVDDLVRFDAHYRSKEEQDQIIRNASIVLLPYDSREQVTSGVLVEALAAGKPIISTAFPHARELGDCGGIALVDHQQPEQIASAAATLLNDTAAYDAMRNAAWLEGLRHDWNIVAPKFGDSLLNVITPSVTSNVVAFDTTLTKEANVA